MKGESLQISSLSDSKHLNLPGMMAHTYNPSTMRPEAKESRESTKNKSPNKQKMNK
jgi:hypothetical protein